MAFCRECGFEVNPSWKFCPNCNSAQPQSDAGSSIQNANVNIGDVGLLEGNITITQNNSEDIAAAMVTALERIGFSGQSSPAELTPSQEEEVEKVLEMSEQLAGRMATPRNCS